MKMQPTNVHAVVVVTYAEAGNTDEHKVTMNIDLSKRDYQGPALAKVLGVDDATFERTSMAAFVTQQLADLVTRLLSAHMTDNDEPKGVMDPNVIETPMPRGDSLN